MRIGYADPPYIGQAKKHYAGQPDYEGEVCHRSLIARLQKDFDGWVLHASAPSLAVLLPMIPEGVRVMAWVKPFAAFKKNVSVAFAWEPVLVKACRKPVVSRKFRDATGIISRDWIAESITLKRGMTGAKPERVCWWAFQCVGALPGDTLEDLFPGTGAVGRSWQSWCELLEVPDERP